MLYLDQGLREQRQNLPKRLSIEIGDFSYPASCGYYEFRGIVYSVGVTGV